MGESTNQVKMTGPSANCYASLTTLWLPEAGHVGHGFSCLLCYTPAIPGGTVTLHSGIAPILFALRDECSNQGGVHYPVPQGGAERGRKNPSGADVTTPIRATELPFVTTFLALLRTDSCNLLLEVWTRQRGLVVRDGDRRGASVTTPIRAAAILPIAVGVRRTFLNTHANSVRVQFRTGIEPSSCKWRWRRETLPTKLSICTTDLLSTQCCRC